MKKAFRSLQKEVTRTSHRQRRRAHRRSRSRPTSVPLSRRSRRHRHRARHRLVPAGRDAGAVGRRRSACRAWSRCSTRSRSTTRSATCTTTTSRRSRPVRPVGSVRRSGARSVTVRSPSGRSLPVLPTLDGVAVHAARRLRRARVERLDVDGVGLRLDVVVDGRGCADQGAGRGHRDGSRVRRRQVHDAHRHPRCRGRVRRHGLQGRGHRGVRHRAAARHEDRRHPGRRARRRRCARRRKRG